MKRPVVILCGLMCSVLVVESAGARGKEGAASRPAGDDRLIEAAKQYVEGSDRYLHQSRLRRGMKGYGLTVLAGTQIVRFDAEIVSVVGNWGPHADVILVRLSGQDLEKTGIIAGMSGSPVFVKDERDGKDKMIGAVAYGWRGCKDPIGGVQPIAQMLAVEGFISEITGKGAPTSAPAPEADEASAGAADDTLMQMAALRERGDVRRPWLAGAERAAGGNAPGLVPLTTPLMVTGMSPAAVARAREALGPMGLAAVQGGGVTPADAKTAAASLVPGGGIAVALVTGDADMSAVGTVTEVVGKHVLAFGHPFFQEGDVSLPMAPAYIHTIIPGLMDSFKLGTGLQITGTLYRDEYPAVAGRVGAGPTMIPVTVTADWPGRQRAQTFRFQVVRHPRLTAAMLDMVIANAVSGWRDVPEFHHVRHTVSIDFGALGKYQTTNVTSGSRLWALTDEAVVPVFLMMRNRFAKPPKVESIRVDVQVISGDIAGQIEDFRIDGEVYRPGETVTGQVTLRRMRQSRERIGVRFDLPADLPEGSYTLSASDASESLRADMKDSPHLFDPQTMPQLLQAIQRTVGRANTGLYLRLPLPEGGLALQQGELPSLPPSVAGAIADARPMQAHLFSRAILRSQETPLVIVGAASASFSVTKQPKQTLLRPQKEPAHE